MNPFPPGSLRRILLVRIGRIGDLIVSSFAIRKVRQAHPGAEIRLVTLARNRELFRYGSDVDRVHTIRGGADLLPLIFTVRKFKPDLLLDFNDNPSRTSTLLARFSGARARMGFSFDSNTRFLTHPVQCPPHEQTHITERLRSLVEAAGIPVADYETAPHLVIGPDEMQQTRRHMTHAAQDKPVIAVNISAGRADRYWQNEKWTGLLQAIAAEDPRIRFLLLHAPGDEHLAGGISARLDPGFLLEPAGRTFHHFAASIACSRLLISPDTSAIHIAACFRIPVVGLYPAVQWNFSSGRPIHTDSETIRPHEGLVADIPLEAVTEAFRKIRDRIDL